MSALLPVLTVLALGACSSPAPTDTPTSAPSVTAPAPPPAVKLIDITVTGRSVSPPPGRVEVKQGEQVRMVIHSDTPDEIHVHGYDIEKPVGPGQDAVIEFAATQTGLFEVETHESKLLLTQLAVR